jgi:hypothetical protein
MKRMQRKQSRNKGALPQFPGHSSQDYKQQYGISDMK